MARFYEADTVDGIPVLINIDHIQTIKPYESTIGDYDMTKTTICHERFMFTSIDLPYETVVKNVKARQDSPKEKIY